jgi:murein DD-endopeptidase MepM/ murein hydrolase activator NlpD
MFAPLLALSLAASPRLEVHPDAPVPGGILVIDAWNVDKASALSGEVVGMRLHFFSAGAHHQRALVALKLEQPAGDLPIAVDLKGGEALETTAHVAAKEFPKRELTVKGKYVSPPKSEAQHIEQDKVAIKRAYDQPFGPALFVGQLSLPRPGAEVTAHFGDQRTYNGKKQSEHYGTDFDGKIGEPILSAAEGVVVMARGCYMSGNTVIVNHGGGLFTSYFHMSRMDVKDGQKVGRGEQLGLVGKTGRVTGPHLHFGVKVFARLADGEEALKLPLGLDPPSGAATSAEPGTALTSPDAGAVASSPTPAPDAGR